MRRSIPVCLFAIDQIVQFWLPSRFYRIVNSPSHRHPIADKPITVSCLSTFASCDVAGPAGQVGVSQASRLDGECIIHIARQWEHAAGIIAAEWLAGHNRVNTVAAAACWAQGGGRRRRKRTTVERKLNVILG